MKKIHINTLTAYYELLAELPNRQAQVFKACLQLRQKNKQITDRTIKDFLGFHDMNQVRPRVSELIKSRKIIETDSINCPLTNRRVRVLSPVT